MKKEKQYRRIEKQLDKIIVSEINARFSGKRKKQNPGKVREIIEKRNREIVTAHQRGSVALMVPALFKGYLQIQEGGELYFEKGDFSNSEFEIYFGRKSRLQALANASLNAMTDETLIQTIYRKKSIFEEEYRKAKEVVKLIEKADEIRRRSDEIDLAIPKDEEEAVSYLKNIAPLKADVQKIESRYIELKQSRYLAQVLQQLQNSINFAFKSIGSQSKKASEFLFLKASAVFKNYRATRANIAGIDAFIRQKEDLIRYYTIFDSIGDEDRRDQINSFVCVIEKSIEKLRGGVERQKQLETEISEKQDQEVHQAYQRFLDIKKQYADGKLEIENARKKAVSVLKKSCNALKASGLRIKAREVERFLNSTGIEKSEASENVRPVQNLFYKKAFLMMLPVTLLLAALNVYQAVSGYKAKARDEIVAVSRQKEAKTQKQPETVNAVPSPEKSSGE
jgi:hypothetical protein